MGELRSAERLTPRLVHAALGVLLLAAAGLKLYGLNVSPFAQYGWLTALWVQMLAVGWEVVLGLWLLSGACRAGAWVAAVGTFATFAAVSGYLGWIGQASCGCFGVIQASPWHAFAVDVTALALLAVARPDWRAARAERLAGSGPGPVAGRTPLRPRICGLRDRTTGRSVGAGRFGHELDRSARPIDRRHVRLLLCHNQRVATDNRSRRVRHRANTTASACRNKIWGVYPHC